MSPDKSKLTREEREAQYKAARERIFGDFQESVTSESASNGENSASMSRSSSSSGKKKARKQKTPKDDSFEARSAYIPSYTPVQMSHMQSQFQPQYPEQAYQGHYLGAGNGYSASMNYGSTPTQSYPNFEPSMPYNSTPMGYGPSNTQSFSPADSWSSVQTPSSNGYFNYPASPNTYQQNMSPLLNQMNSQYMPQSHPGMQQPQNWMNNQYQVPYPQPQSQASSNMSGWPAYQPPQPINNAASYGYGQIPGQTFGGNTNQPYNAQYANPSSYNRSLFNPQTRSFVPSNATSRNGGRNNGRKKPSPASSQNQTRNNSIAAASRPFNSDNSGVQPPTRPLFENRPGSYVSSTKPIPGKEDSLQQKYGAPAHLPKKPPPSQVMSSYEAESISTTNNVGAELAGSNPAQGPGDTVAVVSSNHHTGSASSHGSSA